MSDVHHKEWFITTLVPYIRIPLLQQKIASQAKAPEIAMKLETSPIGESGIGMSQIQSQLMNLTIQLQDIKKGKDVCEEVWCNQCRSEGHNKD